MSAIFRMKKNISLIVFLNLFLSMTSQIHEIGFSIGGSNYVGDIGSTNYINPNTQGGTVFYKYNWNPRIAFKGTYSFLPIKANDANASTALKKSRGFSFSNTIHEIAVGIEFNYFEYDLSSQDKIATPYISIEFAAFNYRYITEEASPNNYIYDNKTSFTVPIAIGYKSKLIGNLAVAIETKMRYTLVDDLDYATKEIPALDYGGTGNDWYFFSGASLIYTFGRPPCYAKGI